MSFENQRIRGVNNQYGSRETESGAGSFTTNGPERIYEITLDQTAIDEFLPEVTIFAGEIVKEVTTLGVTQYVTTGGTVDLTLTTVPGGVATDYAVTEAELEVAPDAVGTIASLAAGTRIDEDSTVSITGKAGTFTTFGEVKVQIKTQRVV